MILVAIGAAKGIKFAIIEVSAKTEFEGAFASLKSSGVQAVIVLRDTMLIVEGKRIADLAGAAHLPSVFGLREPVEAGGLISYGVNVSANDRRAAYFVDKILKGAKPGDLPVEFPTKLELVVNLKTAKALGVTITQSLLLRADDVIE